MEGLEPKRRKVEQYDGCGRNDPVSTDNNRLSQEQLIEQLQGELIKTKQECQEKINKLEEENCKLQEEKKKAEEEKFKLAEEKHVLEKFKANQSLAALFEIKEGQLNLAPICGTSSHKPTNHLPLEGVLEGNDFVLYEPNVTALKESFKRSGLLVPLMDAENSCGELKFNTEPYSYGNEADITHLIQLATADAISILAIEGRAGKNEFSAKLERSLFSCRPDIIVIRNTSRLPLLAIEVKRPLPSNADLREEKEMLGHAFDHAQAMEAFGQGTPIAILTTFNESVVCSVDERGFKDMCSSPLQNSMSTHDAVGINSPSKSQSPAEFKSPPRITNCVSNDTDSSSSTNPSSQDLSSHLGDNESLFTKGLARKMWLSPTHKSHELVRIIYTALRLATEKYNRSTKKIWKLKPDTQISLNKVFQMGKDRYDWGGLHFQLGQEIRCKDIHEGFSIQQELYYIIGTLGHGATSNVFHALDSTGKEVAIKMYVNNIDPDNGQQMSTAAFTKVAKKAVENEHENFVTLYPHLQDEVQVVTLCKFHCLVMPFFAPVMKENREETLNEVQKVLTDAFLPRNLSYKDDDVRWRHVGYFKKGGKEECILYDLADLEELEHAAKVDSVAKHIEKLKERMQNEPQNKSTVLRDEGS